jgi:hypothetical protein
VLSRHCRGLAGAFTGIAALLLVSQASGARLSPALPGQMPPTERARLQHLAESASVSAHVAGQPFVVRRDIFEFLLDHPELTTHVTRALRLARYRIWRDPDSGLWFDDGWGVVGQFTVVYAAPGTRVVHARGEYQSGLMPSIQGQAVVVLEYGATPAGLQHSLISAAVRGFVKLDNGFYDFVASRLAATVVTAKAEKEARRLVKTMVKLSRWIDENPAHVHEQLRLRPGVPTQDLEEFRRLLRLP